MSRASGFAGSVRPADDREMTMSKRVVAVLLAVLASLAAGTASAGVTSGSYTGNGSVSRAITGLGFRPDLVIIKGDSGILRAVVRTATMGASKEMTGTAPAASGYVLSLDPDGFTVGNNSRVNQAGVAYSWIAFETEPGESKVGSYIGNSNNNRSIAGVGFSPSYVIVIPESGDPVYQRTSLMAESYDFDNSNGDQNHIQGMLADGFQIGNHSDVNHNGDAYHYVAWKAVPGRMAVGSYVGLGTDNRPITGLGFRPAYAVVKSRGGWYAVHKPVSTGPATDNTLFFNQNANEANLIQALQADGFLVGSHPRVNGPGDTIYWMAWGTPDSSPLVTTRGGSTITVETSAVKMVWDESKGAGLHQFYGKTEANPGTSRVGADGSYNLFATAVNNGAWIQEAAASGALTLLEAVPTRVRIRQKRDFISTPSGAHLERDWTVYRQPRLALRETLAFDTSLSLRGLTGLHPKGEGGCGGSNTFYCAGQSDAVNRIWLATDNGTTYSDMLAVPYTSPFFGRAGTTPAWDDAFEAGAPNTWATRVRETIPVSASGDDTRFYLLYPHLERLTAGGVEWQPYANDYRSPSTPTLAQGSVWVDPAENTAPGEAFNEAEGAYVFTLDPATGLDLSLDGSVTNPRVRPFFKIRQWRSLQDPATVVLQGTALVNDRDYTADVKPLSYAALCPDPTCATATQLARGGLVGDANEYLGDSAHNFTLGLASPGVQYLYMGADSKFRGLNVALQTAGTGAAALKWEYWSGSAWADLGGVGGFTDLTANLTRGGTVFWSTDPAGWTPAPAFAGWPSLYYVRVSLASGSYVTSPVESQIKTDILLFQYLGDITASGRRFVIAPASVNTNYRSIGTRANYGTAGPEGPGTTVTATLGSTVVTGSGTAWRTANRGRGDRVQIGGVNYTIYAVDSDTQLELAAPFAGTTGAGQAYVIARQFPTLVAWQSCISGSGSCGAFASVTNSLVTDNRSEVGIVYRDTALAGGLTIDGAATDANHTITLTADHGDRHYGRTGNPAAVVDNATNTGPAIRVRDDYVTVEWLEIKGGSGAGAHGIEVSNLATVNHLVFDALLIHNLPGSGIEILHPDAVADVYNNVIYEAGYGVRISTTPSGTSRIRLLDNTVFSCNSAGPSGIRSTAASNGAVTLRNNLAHSNNQGDFAVPSLNPASSNNLSGDGTGPTHSPGGGGLTSASAGAIFVSAVAGSENLHLLPGGPAVDRGTDLGTIFTGDIDAGVRSGVWDVGADEVSAGATDLTVTKDDGVATVVPGGTVVYTITVRNNGPAAVSSLKMVDVTPPGLTSPSFAAPSRGTYDPGTGTWDFTVPPLPLGVDETATIQLVATIDPASSGVLANTATVFPPPGVSDPVPQNDSATDTDALAPSADVGLAMTGSADPADLGGLLTYTLTVTNGGPSAATGVILTDSLPASMEFDSAVPTPGVCAFDAPTHTLTCDLGALGAPGSATVALGVRPHALGTFTNTATVVRIEPDPISANDSAAVTTTVQAPSLAVRFLTVTSTSGRNVIEWLNPTADYVSTELVVRTDRFPADATDGTSLYNLGTAGAKDRFVHDTPPLVDGQTYFYGAFVHRSVAPLVSPGRFVRGRPFDTAGAVKWAFSTGGFSVTPPTVGGAGIIATSNDLAVHAMARGPAGGEWPAGWLPFQVGGPVQSRSPVVPITAGAANPVVFLGAQDGYVYSLDGALGGSPALPPWPPRLVGTVVQAAPAGIFTAFGGAYDYLLVGTRDPAADNALVALDPATGGFVDAFTNGGGSAGIGIVNGTASVDYATGRVFFTSHAKAGGSATTLWCLQLGSTPTVFTGCGWLTPRALGDIDGSPVARGGRIYVGSGAGGGTVYSIDAATGDPGLDRTFVHGDGQVKGFVFPDRNSDDLYFATDNFVWSVSDAAGGMSNNFAAGMALGAGVKPSPALFVPGSHYVYAGGSDGRLYEIDVAAGPGVKSVVLGDGLSVVGAPSLDRGYDLVHVGTEAGTFYAVSVPLP
jgi:uncharacterized repeat protein (TIGR01451 family)